MRNHHHNTQIVACIGNHDPITYLEEVISTGADGLQICVRNSYDNKLMISEPAVWDTTAEVLRGKGHITLEDLFEICANKVPLIIEIPPQERIVPAVVAAIKLYRGRVTISSSSSILASMAHSEMPELPIQLICLEQGREVEQVRTASCYGFTAVNLPFFAVSQHIVSQAVDLNINVNVFTVNAVAHAKSLVELGIHSIFTNNPKLLKEKL